MARSMVRIMFLAGLAWQCHSVRQISFDLSESPETDNKRAYEDVYATLKSHHDAAIQRCTKHFADSKIESIMTKCQDPTNLMRSGEVDQMLLSRVFSSPIITAERLSPLVEGGDTANGILAQRFRFFRVGGLRHAHAVGNTNVGSDMGMLVYIYGPGKKYGNFKEAVVGEYEVDIVGQELTADFVHANYFDNYQPYLGGKAQENPSQRQPGFQGAVTNRYGAAGSFGTGGWYSLPSKGQCKRSDLGKGACRWSFHRRPRLIHFGCLQAKVFAAVLGRGPDPGQEFDPAWQTAFGNAGLAADHNLLRHNSWGLATQGLLAAFAEPAAGGCPEVVQEYACCCFTMRSLWSTTCDAVGEDALAAREVGEDGEDSIAGNTKLCCRRFVNQCSGMSYSTKADHFCMQIPDSYDDLPPSYTAELTEELPPSYSDSINQLPPSYSEATGKKGSS